MSSAADTAPAGWIDRRLPGSVARLVHAVVDPVSQWIDDRCMSLAASVAFFAAFSLAPTLVIVIAVAGFVLGPEAVQGRLYDEIGGLVGHDGAVAIQAMVASAWKADDRALTALLSVAGIVIGASATFGELNAALDRIFRLPPERTPRGWRGLLHVRLVSFGLVIGIAFLLVVLLVLDSGVRAALDWIWSGSQWSRVFVRTISATLMFAALTAAFAVLIKWLPDMHVPWRHAFVGAIAAALLFSLGRDLFALYLGRASATNSMSAAGSLAIVLMWLYYSASVFLLGAEVTVWWRGGRADGAPSAHTVRVDQS